MDTHSDSTAAYDAIADWYVEYLAGRGAAFACRAEEGLRWVLGAGQGLCWDLACGTGVYADAVRTLGWTVAGSDLSLGQLRHAASRMPVSVANATQLPLPAGTAAAVISMLCHTDIDDYSAVCRAAAAALTPGGRFAHVGVHPCFIGAFADRSDPDRTVLTPGYWSREWTRASWADGIRARVGAVHLPLSELFQDIMSAGFTVDTVCEIGEPTPDVLAIGARVPTTQ